MDLDTVMPYGLAACGDDMKALAERLRIIKERSGISKFVLFAPTHIVRVVGMLDIEGYAKIGRQIREVKELVAADGIDVGYLMMPTMNCGINHPWRQYKRKNGSIRAFTPCPGDSGFQAHFAEKCAALAREAHPFLFMMEDDFRYFFEGCFCEEHTRRYAEQKDRTVHEILLDDLKSIAKKASDAILAVSPETRIGLCAPGGFPERDTDMLARLLAGPDHRPYIRYYGAIYGNDNPLDIAAVLYSAQWARENLQPDVEYVYEADPVPNSRFYASASRMNALVSSTAAMGYDGVYYWGLSSASDALQTTPEYLDLHKRNVKRWDAIRKIAHEGRSSGVYAEGNWMRVLNIHGIPVVRHADADVMMYSGPVFDNWSESQIRDVLSKRIVIDGAAAESLTRRGFADLIGVKAAPRESVDFTGESAEDGSTTFPCAFHQNYGLDGCAVSRLELAGAEEEAFLFAAKRESKVQPSATLFKNSLGGTVAVFAINLENCVSPNIYSFSKREFILKLLRKMGGADVVPARVVDMANITLIANEDQQKSRLMLHLVSMHCDIASSVTFEIGTGYAGGAVQILDGSTWHDADAKWTGNRLTVSTSIPVYGTVVLNVHGV